MIRTSKTRNEPIVVFGEGLIALDIITNGEMNPPRVSIGGSCGNVLSILAHLGLKSYPIGLLSHGPATRVLTNQLKKFGVYLEYLKEHKKGRTPVIIQEISKSNGGQTTHRFRFRCMKCGKRYPRRRKLKENDLLELTNYVQSTPDVFYFDRLSEGTVRYAERLYDKKSLVFFEPVYVRNQGLLDRALASCHILKYSSEQISISNKQRKNIRANLEIRTRAESGLEYRIESNKQKWTSIGPVKISKVVDSAGAGDWCTAGILLFLAGRHFDFKLTSNEWIELLRNAQSFSALNCLYEGALGAAHNLSAEDIFRYSKQLLQEKNPVVPKQESPGKENSRLLPLLCSECRNHVSYQIDSINISSIVS